MVKYENERSPQKREQYFKKLTEVKAKLIAPEITEVLEYVSEWYHPVIREMTGLDTFYSDPAWIAKNLHYKLMPMQAKESLELLEKLDLIEFNADEGRHRPKGGTITPAKQVQTMAAIRYHQKMIEIGRESITSVDVSKREINSLTMCMSDDEFEKIKEYVRKTCEKAMKTEGSSTNKKNIYQLNIQFFPFTKDGTRREQKWKLRE